MKDFEANSVEEKPDEWVIELIEKPDRIPAALKGKEVVLDGYCNEVDILMHSHSRKYTYASYGAGGSRKEIAGITAMNMICTYQA